MRISLAIVLVGLIVTARQINSQNCPFDATSMYRRETIQGFVVLVNPRVIRHQAEATQVRQEIERQLKNIKDVVPAERLAGVRQVRIWVEWTGKTKDASMFHPSAVWLRAHGYNPEKAGGVEIADATKFLAYSRDDQPWLLLHELAHAYHFHVLGENHEGIENAFQKARASGAYDNVCHADGTKRKAYAVERDAKEYFAELTEAYFGRNDFFPFTRKELELHDPDGYKLLAALWGEPNRTAPTGP